MIPATLRPGLPDDLRAEAAALYWQAFGPKLGRVLGPEPRALAFLARVMRTDQAIAAIGADGALLGFAGYRTLQGGFASGTAQDLAAIYGRFGGYWRGALLGRLAEQEADEAFLLDGICVAETARGQGIGSALVEAVAAKARQRGHGAVRLDVVAGNTRAIALYQRLGFRITARQNIGLLRLIFRFDAALTMLRDV